MGLEPPRPDPRGEPALTTFLFTDIEGSTRLWEEHPDRMGPALARHDELARAIVAAHRGEVVKMTGDGIHAAFRDPLDGVAAALEFQVGMLGFPASHGIDLPVRCGIHLGASYRRDADYFGAHVNRAARIMSAAHGGQVLLSAAVVSGVDGRLPPRTSLRDLGPVRLRDLGGPQKVFQLVHEGLRADFPALRGLEATPTNLPHEWNSLIGRETESARACELLRAHRLVTLVGMGGLGKTRLSVRVASLLVGEFPDGVWFVELGPVGTPGGVALAVASVLGVREEAGRPLIEALARHLAGLEVLLVLDNCEHLLPSCAEFSKTLLQAAPRLRILATSREHLRVTGEATLPLAALPVPDLRAPFEPLVLAQNDAARLFIERATASQPDFEVTSENAAAIAAVCHRLDGIPLALELAAARLRTLTIDQIAAGLVDRFKLLKGGDPTLLPRQQTLRALIDWSYGLLSETERRVLRQLAVFAGGWNPESLAAVCECDGDEGVEIVERLAEKSLVVVNRDSGRRSLLETVRVYALEHLDASGDAAGARARHLAFHAAFADEAKKGLWGATQSHWLARLDEERENILAAHAYAGLAPQCAPEGLRLISALKLYWINRGLLELGHRLTAEALDREGASERNFPRCKALFDLGQIEYYMGRYGVARETLSRGLEIARELQHAKAVTTILLPLGMAALGDGEPVLAGQYLEEAFALNREGGDAREIAVAASHLGQLRRTQDRNSEARELFDSAIASAQSLDDAESVAIAKINLAMLAIAQSRPGVAAPLLEEALQVAAGLNAKRLGQGVIEVCAALEASQSHVTSAALLWGAGESHAAATGMRREPADEQFLAPIIEAARATGGPEFRATEAEGRDLPYEDAIRWARQSLATYRQR